MTRVFLIRHGEPDESFDSEVLEVVNEAVSALEPQTPMIEVHVFPDAASVRAFQAVEARELGVVATDLFFAMHDAWRGYPRILVCRELAGRLPREVLRGGLVHEVGHAVLHGSIEYYVFSAPSELEALRGRLGTDVCNRILYLVSIAVKDYEVTSLLLERGLAGTQPQFLRYVLRVSDEEVRTWRAAWSAEAKILHLLSVFKVLACAWPMARRGEYASEVGRWIGDAVSYLPASYSSALYSLLGALEGARGTTHEKVYAVVREAVRLLVLPLLGGRET